MLFSKVLFFLAATTVSALAHSKRVATPAKALADFKLIDGDLKNLTTVVKAWPGNTAGLIPIFQKVNLLYGDLNATAQEIKGSPVYSCADSAPITNFISNPLVADVRTDLAAFQSRKPDFDKTGASQVVRDRIGQLRTLADNVLSATIATVCAAQKASVTSSKNAIDAAIDQTIKFFAA